MEEENQNNKQGVLKKPIEITLDIFDLVMPVHYEEDFFLLFDSQQASEFYDLVKPIMLHLATFSTLYFAELQLMII